MPELFYRGRISPRRALLIAVCGLLARSARAQIRVDGLQSGGPRPAASPSLDDSSSGLEDYGMMWVSRQEQAGAGSLGPAADPLAGLKGLPPSSSLPMRDAPLAEKGMVRLPDGRVLPWAPDRVPLVPPPKPRQAPGRASPPEGAVLKRGLGRALPVAQGFSGLVWGGYGESDARPAAAPGALLDHLRRPTLLPASLEGLGAESLLELGREDYLRRAGAGGGSLASIQAASGVLKNPASRSTFIVAELRLPPGVRPGAVLPGLASETGFEVLGDPSGLAAGRRGVEVRGWIEESRLGAFLRHPWVAQAAAFQRPVPAGRSPLKDSAGENPADSKFPLLPADREAVYATLRLPAGLSAKDGLRSALGRLSAAGFEWGGTTRRVAPAAPAAAGEAGALVVVYGWAPKGRLAAFLQLPCVRRLDPAEGPRRPAPPPAPSLRKAIERPLWFFAAASLLLGFAWASSFLRFLLSLL